MFEKHNDKEASRKIMKKRNDLSIYKKILEEMNKIYTMVGNKVYESPDYIENFYGLYWQWIVDLNKLNPQKREILRRNSFIKEKEKRKKGPYVIVSQWHLLTPEEKKANFLASFDGNQYRITVEKILGTAYFVSERLYLNREKIFLSKLRTAPYRKVNARP